MTGPDEPRGPTIRDAQHWRAPPRPDLRTPIRAVVGVVVLSAVLILILAQWALS
jgi:hypothetical protein